MELRRLFDYDAWANQAAIASVARAARPPARLEAVTAHIIAAEWVWWARLHQESPRFPVWPALSLQQCETEVLTLAQQWRDYVGVLGTPELAVPVRYTNTKGKDLTSTVEDILLHVLMHSAYHRGQIASGLRAAGADPANTDYIEARRQGFVA